LLALLSHLPVEKLPKLGNKIGKENIEQIKRLELVNCIDLQVSHVVAINVRSDKYFPFLEIFSSPDENYVH